MAHGLLAYAIDELRSRSGRTDQRYIDLCISWQTHQGAELASVGGVWDRRAQDWCEDRSPTQERVLRLTPAQLDAGNWLAEWFRSYLLDDWEGTGRAWSCLLFGGRRAGKTWLLAAALATFAVARPDSIVLGICTTQDGADEVHQGLVQTLGPGWFRFYEDEARYLLENGSSIKLAGAGLRTSGKQGRIDFAAINEAQLVPQSLYRNLRGAIADTGGLVLLTANPPDRPEGQWLEDHWSETRAGHRDAVEFFVDNTRNPFIDLEALSSLRKELPPLDYAREIEGRMGLPPPEAVFYTWSDEANLQPVPQDWVACTQEVTAELLKRKYQAVLGQDFDKSPYLATSVLQAYRPPAGTVAEACWWVVDSIILQGDEDAVIDAILERGYSPSEIVVVGDASGDWQDVERKRGSNSFDYFRARGFRIVKPDPRSEKNPPRNQRERVGNALLCNADGQRRLFVDPREPRVVAVAEALKKWPRKSGKSDARSKYAHICDSVTYPLWRLYGRRLPKRKAPAQGRPRGGPRAMRVRE